MPLRIIDTKDDLGFGLDELCKADPQLSTIRDMCSEIPLRRSEPGFKSLVSIVVSQQVSKASAAAIFGRLQLIAGTLTAEAMISADDDLFREAGLSRPKQKTIVAIARAEAAGELDLLALCRVPPAEAIDSLISVHGIGPWTAQVYLMFAAGHPDIFPSGDVALQTAAGRLLDLADRPQERELAKIAESWSPWRSVAARLLWAYYAVLTRREAVPL